MEIRYTPRFERSFRKLSPEIKKKAIKKEKVFRKNPFHPSLRTHKLSGNLKNLWAFSITHSHRLVFEFLDENTIVVFIIVGDHSVYDRL